MIDQVINLTSLCRQYIDEKISVEGFISQFDAAYFLNQEKLPEPAQSILDEIYVSNSYYEPDNEIRKDDACLLTEAELKNRVREQLNKITV
jgi:hypothetical protein